MNHNPVVSGPDERLFETRNTLIEQPGAIDLFGLFKIILKKIHPLYNIECAALLIYNDDLTATRQAYLSTFCASTGDISSIIYSIPVILNPIQREIAAYEFPVLKSKQVWESEFGTNQSILNGETHYLNHCYIPLEVENRILGTLELHNNHTEFSKECLTFCSNIADLFADAILSAGNPVIPKIISKNPVKSTTVTDQDRSLIDTLLDLSEHIGAVRTTPDLQRVINQYLAHLPYFNDLVIARINPDQETYSFYLFNSESVKLSDSLFLKMANSRFFVKDGVFDKISNGNQPVIYRINDLMKRKDGPAHISLWAHFGYVQLLGISLSTNKEFYGVIFLPIAESATLNENQISLIKSVSAQIGVALANIQIQDDLLMQQRDKDILLTLGKELAAAKSRNHIGEIVSRNLKQIFNFKQIVIRMILDDGLFHENYFCSVKDFKKLEKAELMNIGTYAAEDSLFSTLQDSDNPLILDLTSLKESELPPYMLCWQHNGVEQSIATRLYIGDVLRGILFINLQQPGNFDKASIELLKGVASQTSIAIWNVKSDEKIRLQLQEISDYKQQLEGEKLYLQEEILATGNYTEIIGSGPEMQHVFRLLDQVSKSDTTVLILGETGTGKELIARAIHTESDRKNKLMIKVNCAAIPPNLIESELFGHEKGSFTGATERRIGKFELADNSTLFLDEIGELSLELQVKLLRVLQEKEFERVGGKATLSTNVRVVSATNRNLLDEVKAGRFRQDLYYRLNVFPISLPPLRGRRQDIPLLATYFLERYARKSGKKMLGFSQKALKDIINYSWPGNVRELEHLIERQVLLSTGPLIKELEFPSKTNTVVVDNSIQQISTIDENERDHILKVLKFCNGKISGQDGAARLLGVPATTLNSKIKRLGITKKLTT